MMGSTLPPTDTSTVFAILRLLADPKAAEAKFKELVEADAKNALKLQEISKRDADLAKRESALAEQKSAAADAAAKQGEREAKHSAKEAEWAEKHAAVAKKLAEKEDDLSARERSLQARTEACNLREAQFDEIDRKLKLREQQVNEQRAFYEVKIQEIKRLAG
jgi:hypothetical protein